MDAIFSAWGRHLDFPDRAHYIREPNAHIFIVLVQQCTFYFSILAIGKPRDDHFPILASVMIKPINLGCIA